MDVPHCLNLRALLRCVSSVAPAMLATVTSTLRLHMLYCSYHQVSRSKPVNTFHMVYLLNPHRCDLVCVLLFQSRSHSHMSVPPTWEHILCAQLLPCKRSASTVLAGTHNPVGADPRAGTDPFPKPRALALPMVKFVQSKPDGQGYIDTADSDLMQTRRAGTPLTSSRLPVEGSMRLFSKKPVIMFCTSLISSLRTLATRTSPSCSTRTPSSPTLWCSHTRKTPQVKVRGVWSYSSFDACCDALHFLEHLLFHVAQYTSTMSWPRNVMLPLIFLDGYMGT